MPKRASAQTFNVQGHHTADFTSLQDQHFVFPRATDLNLLVPNVTFLYSLAFESFQGILNCTEAIVRRCSSKIGVLKNFANATGKHLCWSLFLKTQVLSCEICEIFKNTFLTEQLRWLLLSVTLGINGCNSRRIV